MDLQNKIYSCRKNAGLSQEALAERIGVSRQAISKWETGEAMPEVAKLLALAKTFGVTTDWMLSDESDMPETELKLTDDAVKEPVEEAYIEAETETCEPIEEAAEDSPAADTTTSEQDPEPTTPPSNQSKWQTFLKRIYDNFGAWAGAYLFGISILLLIYGFLFYEFAWSHFGYGYFPLLGQINILASYGSLVMFTALAAAVFSVYLMFALRKFNKVLTIQERIEHHEAKLRKREERLANITKRFGWTWAILIPCIASLIFSFSLVMIAIPGWFEELIMFAGFVLFVLSILLAVLGIVLICKLYSRAKAVKKAEQEKAQ